MNKNIPKLRFITNIAFWIAFVSIAIAIVSSHSNFIKAQPFVAIIVSLVGIAIDFILCELTRLILLVFADMAENIHRIRLSKEK